jgi:hypothetical protein
VAADVSRGLFRPCVAGAAAWLVATACVAAGKPVSTDQTITERCDELGKAILDGHIDRAVTLTFPALVALAGRDRIVEAMQAAARGTAEFKTLSITCQIPSQHSSAGGFDLALVPTLATVTTPRGPLFQPQHYLAISADRGRNWTFLLLAPGATPGSLRKLLPDGIGDIALPAAQKPFALRADPASAP